MACLGEVVQRTEVFRKAGHRGLRQVRKGRNGTGLPGLTTGALLAHVTPCSVGKPTVDSLRGPC
ncbi:hypothetical protein GCM10022251_06880 [Phytohabitans flavus]